MHPQIISCCALALATCLSMAAASTSRAADSNQGNFARMAALAQKLDRCQTLSQLKDVARGYRDVLIDSPTVRYLDSLYESIPHEGKEGVLNRLLRRFCQDSRKQGTDRAAELLCVRVLAATLQPETQERSEVLRLLRLQRTSLR